MLPIESNPASSSYGHVIHLSRQSSFLKHPCETNNVCIFISALHASLRGNQFSPWLTWLSLRMSALFWASDAIMELTTCRCSANPVPDCSVSDVFIALPVSHFSHFRLFPPFLLVSGKLATMFSLFFHCSVDAFCIFPFILCGSGSNCFLALGSLLKFSFSIGLSFCWCCTLSEKVLVAPPRWIDETFLTDSPETICPPAHDVVLAFQQSHFWLILQTDFQAQRATMSGEPYCAC